MATKVDIGNIVGIESIKGQKTEANSFPVVLATEQDIAKAEDSAHVSGDYGALILAVRKDTAAALAGADADYIPLIVDASGQLYIAPAPANDGVDIGDVDVATINTVAPQFDDTDKLAVSLYGKGAAAGDTELPAFSNSYPGSISPVTSTPTAYNVTLTNADTEYSQALPANAKGFEFQCRTAYDVRYAFATGKVAGPTAPYLTLKAGSEYYKENVKLASTTLYLASAQAGVVVEIIAWA